MQQSTLPRLSLLLLRRLACLRSLSAVARATAVATVNTRSVVTTANDVIAHARKVLHPAATDHDDRVFLQVMAFPRDVGRDFGAVAQANARNLTKRGVRFLRGHGGDLHANAALERRALRKHGTLPMERVERVLHRRRLGLRLLRRAALADQLIDGWHKNVPAL